MSSDVVVVIGAGAIGQAIARRHGTGRRILLADRNPDNLAAAAAALQDSGHQVMTRPVDVAERDTVHSLATAGAELGAVTHVVHTAGLSPVQASPEAILAVDLYGVAVVLEEFGQVVAPGGAGLVVSSMAGHMLPALPADHASALATTPADQLLQLPFLSPDNITSSGAAYAIAKRANQLRVRGAAVTWGDRGARVNSISPGIVLTPLARDEMSGPGGAGYRTMIEQSAAGRVGTVDEIAAAASLLLGPDGGFITGSDLLIDGGVIAAIHAGRIQLTLGS